MILTFIFVMLIILGFMIIKYHIGNDPDISGVSMIVIGSFALIISFIAIIMAHATANMNIQKNKIKYEGLKRRYDIITSEYEYVSKSDVISDITENPWTNWFNPKEIAYNLHYIPLDQESEELNEQDMPR